MTLFLQCTDFTRGDKTRSNQDHITSMGNLGSYAGLLILHSAWIQDSFNLT